MATGTTTVDFGAFPGSSHATMAITGQAAIVAGSLVEAWIRPVATADHSADEHIFESIQVIAADIVAGTGFTIHAKNTSELFDTTNSIDKQGTRLYGLWTVAWAWT